MIKENKQIFFSACGYIQVDSEQYQKNQLIPFTSIDNTMTGTINKNSLMSTITVRLKTLYGNRKIHTINLSVNDPVSTIFKLFKKQEDASNDKTKFNSNLYRIISSKGQIKELHLSKKIYEEKIENNQLLILAPTTPSKFSDVNHGNQISIEGGTLVNKVSGDDLQLALIDKGYSRDTSYTEFILETEPDERGILVGISLKRNDFYLDSVVDFWGYILSDALKISSSVQSAYGKACKMGDKVGVLLSFGESNKGSVSFFLNGVNLGVAFDNLPKNTYYPAVALYYEGSQAKIVQNAQIPEDIK